jgi:hypothetical protein
MYSVSQNASTPHAIPPKQRPMTSSIRFAIRHRVPGRLRIQVPALGGKPALAAEVETALLSLPGVYRVRTNPACESIVVHHRGNLALSRADMVQALATVIRAPTRSGALVPRAEKGRGRRANSTAQPMDCVLCQLKLSLARFIVSDLWRCWRQDFEPHRGGAIQAEISAAPRSRKLLRRRPAWSEDLSAFARRARWVAKGASFSRSLIAFVAQPFVRMN